MNLMWMCWRNDHKENEQLLGDCLDRCRLAEVEAGKSHVRAVMAEAKLEALQLLLLGNQVEVERLRQQLEGLLGQFVDLTAARKLAAVGPAAAPRETRVGLSDKTPGFSDVERQHTQSLETSRAYTQLKDLVEHGYAQAKDLEPYYALGYPRLELLAVREA